jgi:hypothetical protein
MCSASLTMAAGPTTPASPPDEYVKLAEAARIGGCHTSVIQRLALAQMVRVRKRLGRVLYHRGDVEANR